MKKEMRVIYKGTKHPEYTNKMAVIAQTTKDLTRLVFEDGKGGWCCNDEFRAVPEGTKTVTAETLQKYADLCDDISELSIDLPKVSLLISTAHENLEDIISLNGTTAYYCEAVRMLLNIALEYLATLVRTADKLYTENEAAYFDMRHETATTTAEGVE